MKTEHSKLKEIADKIGYEIRIYKYVVPDLSIHKPEWLSWFNIKKDVREIIFTQEFMDKFFEYTKKNTKYKNPTGIFFHLMEHLDNPVDYLYNLLK